MSARTRVVVVGNGMAGSRLVEELRARDPHRRLAVTVFGSEPHGAYNRVLLSNLLAGRAHVDDIYLTPPRWHAEHDVDLRAGVSVEGIDRVARAVHASDGTTTPYDVLVLATGSRAWLPPVAGLTRADGSLVPGAAVFRTVDDCWRILDHAAGARRALVIGGGLLGLEAARGLAGRGLDVEVLHRADRLMDRQLDAGAGRVLARALRHLGVRTRMGARTVEVLADTRVHGVRLDDGTTLDADLLVVACGVRPETALAEDAGLVVDRGVVVDDQLRSVADDAVYAIGECAQHEGQVYGLVAPAWEQAVVLADVLSGAGPDAAYRGSRLVTRLKAAGVDLAAMGETAAEDDAGTDVVTFADPARGTYKKLVVRDGRLVGAILLGDGATTGSVVQLFDRGGAVPSDPLELLFAGVSTAVPAPSPALMPGAATVCHCNNVTKGAIQSCFLAGARTVPEVAAATRATTGCGSCRDAVEGICEWLASVEPTRAAEVTA